MPNELPHAIDDGRFDKHQEDVYIEVFKQADKQKKEGKPLNPYAVAYSAAEHAKSTGNINNSNRRPSVSNIKHFNASKQIDVNEGLIILSGYKKTLLNTEQEGRIAEQDLEDMRYIQGTDSLQQGYEYAPRLIRAQKKVQDAVALIQEATLLIESAKMDLRGENVAAGGTKAIATKTPRLW